MEQTSFLPDNRPVHCSILANLPFERGIIEKIAEGANPDEQRTSAGSVPGFGLLYLTEDGLGFFVHASESPMAAIFRSTARQEQLKPINFFVPFSSISRVEFVNPRKGIPLYKKILMWFASREDDTCLLAWKPGTDDTEYTLRFFLATNYADFMQKLVELGGEKFTCRA